ncbi:beta-1,4-galactosyltransferase 6-like [Lytechinus variegatus]|uniref:beta-1,4-galactosyltransferase 6-like n=1 Tax=Lytechinus variegatus TaxID=7654 RepID=UPI001BB17F41|nr:beta-1,4-galactosyltransferase 6-like [Lytechinus variegatus]XP_041464059.1 beta-1,4-galactosyltransferase 6-like [Lytechinus variegatus]
MRPNEQGTNGSDYIADISRSNFVTTEEKVFKDLAEKARDLTRDANEHLKILLKDRYNSTLNDKADAKTEPAAQAGMGMTIGSYMYFPGGHWVPMHCKAKWKVAVVIPYRNRSDNLNVLTRNLIQFLKGQDLEFGIFVAEQSFSEIMNRGMMRNIGFQMACLSGTKWDCFVFHDVDFVPLNSTNYYGCDSFPVHFANRLEIFNYTNPYSVDYGGIVGMTGEQFITVNGYSNMYWGWGGEDSDLGRRVRQKFKVTEARLGYYRNLNHDEKTKEEMSVHRMCLYNYALNRIKYDGLSRVRYERSADILLSTLYTKITVDVVKQEWNRVIPPCNRI